MDFAIFVKIETIHGMKRSGCIRMAAVILLIFSGISLSAQNVIYVSPDGRDSADGSASRPMASIEAAQIRARGIEGPCTIMLRGGEYRLSRTLVLTPEDNGLTIKGCAGEKATVKGGSELRLRWKIYRDGIYVAETPQGTAIDMLIVDGKIRSMARYPDYDSTAVRFNGTSADATSPERIRSWSHPEGGYLHAMHAHDWGDFHYRIEGVNEDGTLMLAGGHQNNRQYGIHRDNRMVENIFEELDAPGEWFHDSEACRLYYYPVAGEDVHICRFEVPALKHLVEIRGSADNPAMDIRIEGLELTQTVRTFMESYEPLLRSDWTVYRGGAVFLENTEHCSICGCDLFNLGGNGVFFSNYNRGSSVSGCHITDIGASAVLFVGDPAAVRSPSFEYASYVPVEQMDMEFGPIGNNFPQWCSASDNLIHRIGLFEKQITGVELSMCHFITVSHNSIYDVPRTGINVSEGTWGGHLIEFNDVFDTVKETGDHGSFNSWGRDRFWNPDYGRMCAIAEAYPHLVHMDAISTTVIQNNRFRCDRGWDIDLDDGSSCYLIRNNLLLSGGIKLREGFCREVENNIVVNNSLHPHVWFRNSGDIFRHNVVMIPYQPIGVRGWGSEVDRNIFASVSALINARGNGTDAHSVAAAVEFEDPAGGDFRIRESCSAVFDMGFRNFPMDCFGVVSPRLRAIADAPVLPVPMSAPVSPEDEPTRWYGWMVKNLRTLGERSATGMDSERGVLVVVMSGFDSAFKEILKVNDVILGFNGCDTDSVEQLMEATAKTDKTQPTVIRLFRDQHELTIEIPAEKLAMQ